MAAGQPEREHEPGRARADEEGPADSALPALSACLAAVAADPSAKGWVCESRGEPIRSIKKQWDTMLKALGLPVTREMKAYVIRRSMATLLRERGASAWDVEGQLGHRTAGTTEIYAISSLFPSAYKALTEILADLEKAAPGTLHRRRTGDGAEVVALNAPRRSA